MSVSEDKTLLLLKPRGFCAGVVRAIDIVRIALEAFGPPIYVRKEIVHNRRVVERLKAAGLRAELDDRQENIGYKIREAQVQKVPYMLVVGDREQESDRVALREHRRGDVGSLAVESVIERLAGQVKSRAQG